jgi:hypothetical protein
MLRITFFFLVTHTCICGAIHAQSGDPWADANGIKHQWSFVADFSDLVGNADGTPFGDVQIINGQANFPGTLDSLVALEPTGPNGININTYPEITIEMWATPNGAAMGPFPGGPFTMAVLFADEHPTNPGWSSNYLSLSTHRGDDVTRAFLSVGTDQPPWTLESGANGPELNDNLPHHYVATVNGTHISLYVDGILQDQQPLSPSNFLAGVGIAEALIGAGYPQDPLWIGFLDELRIYCTALKDEKVYASFLAGPDDFPDFYDPLDFNNDGSVTLDDIDHIPRDDHVLENRDALLAHLDLDPGDFDANHLVDIDDLKQLWKNWDKSPVDYQDGDADLDGQIANNDILHWNNNKFWEFPGYNGDEFSPDDQNILVRNSQTGEAVVAKPVDEEDNKWIMAPDVNGIQIYDPNGSLTLFPEDLDLGDGSVTVSTPEAFIKIHSDDNLRVFEDPMYQSGEPPEEISFVTIDEEFRTALLSGSYLLDGDRNGDFKVDQNDLQIFNELYGNGPEGTNGSDFLSLQIWTGFEVFLLGSLVQTVPEPTTVAMLTLVLLCSGLRRTKHVSHRSIPVTEILSRLRNCSTWFHQNTMKKLGRSICMLMVLAVWVAMLKDFPCAQAQNVVKDVDIDKKNGTNFSGTASGDYSEDCIFCNNPTTGNEANWALSFEARSTGTTTPLSKHELIGIVNHNGNGNLKDTVKQKFRPQNSKESASRGNSIAHGQEWDNLQVWIESTSIETGSYRSEWDHTIKQKYRNIAQLGPADKDVSFAYDPDLQQLVFATFTPITIDTEDDLFAGSIELDLFVALQLVDDTIDSVLTSTLELRSDNGFQLLDGAVDFVSFVPAGDPLGEIIGDLGSASGEDSIADLQGITFEMLPESFSGQSADSHVLHALTLDFMSPTDLQTVTSINASDVLFGAQFDAAGADADFDQDGLIDSADLQIWQEGYGFDVSGDADFDGDTDGHDFLHWQLQSGSNSAIESFKLVPEPTTALISFSLFLYFNIPANRNIKRNCNKDIQ